MFSLAFVCHVCHEWDVYLQLIWEWEPAWVLCTYQRVVYLSGTVNGINQTWHSYYHWDGIVMLWSNGTNSDMGNIQLLQAPIVVAYFSYITGLKFTFAFTTVDHSCYYLPAFFFWFPSVVAKEKLGWFHYNPRPSVLAPPYTISLQNSSSSIPVHWITMNCYCLSLASQIYVCVFVY